MNRFLEKARRWGWSVAKVLVVLSVIAGFIYWFRFSPILVSSHTLERGSIVAEVMGTGTLEARVAAAVSPKIAGRIGQLFADQGDRVKAGDLLVQLDDEELQQQVEIAQANVEASQAGILRRPARSSFAEHWCSTVRSRAPICVRFVDNTSALSFKSRT